jgi:hypothetical protein
VRLDARSARPRTIHPIALHRGPQGWAVVDGLDRKRPIPSALWGEVNISARRFARIMDR